MKGAAALSEGFWDSVGNFLHISYTENERKRDEYKNLYDFLSDKESDVKTKLAEVDASLKAYNSNLPDLKIPSHEFEDTRHEKDAKLKELVKHFKDMVDDIQSAKSKAKSKWEYYKAKAEAEEKKA
ncbi:hypothetical protein CHCC14820_1653 [Bacillus paralicheniformis]|uniref:Putative EsaC protein-like protein (Listeria type 1) n=1 Tax=Bacillus paralicheniformis TaxID=1648923 RepID=A0A6I7TJK6_9BACI|nr:putative EsaC protein-like protein (Listeria type 1) [Bacillus paralicheniformis]OLG12539.1 putative EsaC protein-like protein (Listeria type 1) [Bacillus paralicheniformis]TWJ34443.1 hypothetical protein CHCC5027_0004 [Bacillus paralicheniformis]TWJ59587.1 hypothetical protein CHCC5023_0452 [Bacillus paralicheniformis]TWJ71836.1 hypothetical protein CHCC5019_3371 [Bacillus paralicheniformis]